MPEKQEPYVHFQFGRCARCGKILPDVDIPLAGYQLWERGMEIGQACPTLTREQTYIVTHHVCPDCQRKGLI